MYTKKKLTSINIPSFHPSFPLPTPFILISAMAINGNAVHGALPPGHFLFTSESVGEGHPGMCPTPSFLRVNTKWGLDKICDQVSDAIVSPVVIGSQQEADILL
jgi:hypothetical protein